MDQETINRVLHDYTQAPQWALGRIQKLAKVSLKAYVDGGMINELMTSPSIEELQEIQKLAESLSHSFRGTAIAMRERMGLDILPEHKEVASAFEYKAKFCHSKLKLIEKSMHLDILAAQELDYWDCWLKFEFGGVLGHLYHQINGDLALLVREWERQPDNKGYGNSKENVRKQATSTCGSELKNGVGTSGEIEEIPARMISLYEGMGLGEYLFSTSCLGYVKEEAKREYEYLEKVYIPYLKARRKYARDSRRVKSTQHPVLMGGKLEIAKSGRPHTFYRSRNF
jgi:hypothetical protein